MRSCVFIACVLAFEGLAYLRFDCLRTCVSRACVLACLLLAYLRFGGLRTCVFIACVLAFRGLAYLCFYCSYFLLLQKTTSTNWKQRISPSKVKPAAPAAATDTNAGTDNSTEPGAETVKDPAEALENAAAATDTNAGADNSAENDSADYTASQLILVEMAQELEEKANALKIRPKEDLHPVRTCTRTCLL